jgi:hypothetical protein
MKIFKQRYIYICSLCLLISGFAYLIIDFRLFPFHYIFDVCLTGLLLQILEKKIPWVSGMSVIGYFLVLAGSFFIVNASSISYFLLALLPMGYILLTITGNRAGILDNIASIVLVIIFLINLIPYLVVTRLLFGFAIIALGYLSLQALSSLNRNLAKYTS